MLVVVLENPDRFAIRLSEQISCRTSVSLRSRNPDAPRTSTTTRTIPNFGIWVKGVGFRRAKTKIVEAIPVSVRRLLKKTMPGRWLCAKFAAQ